MSIPPVNPPILLCRRGAAVHHMKLSVCNADSASASPVVKPSLVSRCRRPSAMAVVSATTRSYPTASRAGCQARARARHSGGTYRPQRGARARGGEPSHERPAQGVDRRAQFGSGAGVFGPLGGSAGFAM